MSLLFPLSEQRVLTIVQLTRAVKELLESQYSSIWVEGEVSNLARPSSGHIYLTLKDEEASLRAVIYRGVALRLKYDLHDGMRVLARGRLSVYPPRGDYQLLIEEVQPKGIGPLELAFRQRKEKLSLLGYFEPGRKKPLPKVPQRICLLTSATGSAVRDVLEILARRWPLVEVWIVPVRVQGDEAAEQIAAALGYVNQLGQPDGPTPVDVLLLVRGGGSLEDLWPFNEELVAHALFRSRIPVVTGIGHEDDLTLADLVADCRALTPSEAAERVVPDRARVLEELLSIHQRLRTLLRRRLELARAQLTQLEQRPCFRRPAERLAEAQRRLDELAERLKRSLERLLERSRDRLARATDLLEGLSPLKILGRGYSLTRRQENLAVIRSFDQVGVGELILTQLEQGQLVSRIEAIKPPLRGTDPFANQRGG